MAIQQQCEFLAGFLLVLEKGGKPEKSGVKPAKQELVLKKI
jgi:hypothetical protein